MVHLLAVTERFLVMGTHSDLRGEVANVFRLWLFLSFMGVWKEEEDGAWDPGRREGRGGGGGVGERG